MRKVTCLILALFSLVSILLAVPRDLVVVEIATGTWCGYCPGAAMGAHDLLENGHAVAIIKNHNGDSFANTYSNARNSYYGVTGYPTAYFDGLNASVGGSSTNSMYNTYLPRVNARLAVPSRYTIATTGSANNNQYSLNVTVTKQEADTNTNVVLHAVVTETDIPFTWMNQTQVDNVNRLMVPNQNGTPITLATGESTTIPLTFTAQTTWNVAKLELVVFLQNVSTKEILQGRKYPLAGLTGALPVSTTNIEFPDVYVTGTSTQNLVITNFFDTPATGTLSTNNPVFTVSPTTFNIAGGQSQTVTVSFTPTAAQDYTGVLNIAGNLQNHPSINVNLGGTGFLNSAPVAQNVTVVGPPVVYQNLNSSYTFFDADGNTEGNTLIQWYRLVNNQPQAIAGQTLPTYKTAVEDIGYPIVCAVTPYDQHGMPGVQVMSTPTIPIEELPSPRNFTAAQTELNVVVCNWQRPLHFEGRGFVGYRVYRNGLLVSTITNPNNLSFTDTWVPDGTYEYWAVSLFNDPMMISDPSNVATVVTGPTDNDDNVVELIQSVNVSPNPFSNVANIAVKGKANTQMKVSIYNIKGQLVKSYSERTDANGNLDLTWNATDNSSQSLPNGVYFYTVHSADKFINGKIVITK